jgi:hypothetical protein
MLGLVRLGLKLPAGISAEIFGSTEFVGGFGASSVGKALGSQEEEATESAALIKENFGCRHRSLRKAREENQKTPLAPSGRLDHAAIMNVWKGILTRP